MNRFFKNIAGWIWGVVALVVVFILPILIVSGSLWLFSNFFQVLEYIAFAVLGLAAMLILLSIIPTLRMLTGTSLYALSFLFGAIFWLACLEQLYAEWGFLGVFFGLIFFKAAAAPAALAVMLDFRAPLPVRLYTLGIIIFALAIIYGLRAFGIWITEKYKHRQIKRQWFRYITAIIVGAFAGYFLPAPIFVSLDYLVSGGRLIQVSKDAPFNWLIILYMVAIGAATGFLAGLLAEKRGKLIAAIAQLAPMILFLIIEIAFNVDVQSQTTGQANIATWTWVGLIPAIVAGHYGQKYINKLATGQHTAESVVVGEVV